MTDVVVVPLTDWQAPCPPAEQQRATAALEQGNVLLFAQLGFAVADHEQRLLSPAVGAANKNISWDSPRQVLRGFTGSEADRVLTSTMMERFASCTKALLLQLFPRYAGGLQQARTSFRPDEIVGRKLSWRKDDTRLHVDSFPSSPTQGKRILRFFANVNPHAKSRRWRLGESFEASAGRYLPQIPRPLWGTAPALDLLGITKTRRSEYDHVMLQLHDRMKADLAYQAQAPQSAHDFESGHTWMAFTDQVSHAAMSGQYALEQTFYLPVDCMQTPALAPLRVLERLLGRELVDA